MDPNSTIVYYNNKWLFDITKKSIPQASELSFGRIKAYLYESLHRNISHHNLEECFKLLTVLPKETSLDSYVLFRFILILVESNPTEKVNKNVLIYLESILSKLDVCRPDVFVEFMAYFMRHNRLDDAKELFAQRHRVMSYKIHRTVPFIDLNIRSYDFLLNYLDWSAKASDASNKLSFDLSMQGWIVNSIESFKSTSSNHEYFVMCLARVLLFYGFTKKAYLFLSEFQRNNPDNISAQLLLYNLLEQLDLIFIGNENHPDDPDTDMDCQLTEEERNTNRSDGLKTINNFTSSEEEVSEINDYPLKEDRRSILKNLNRLDPSREELLEPKNLRFQPIEGLRYVMDGLEVADEVKNIARWSTLRELIEYIFTRDDESLIIDAKFLWHSRYKTFWNYIDFLAVAGSQISNEDRLVIEEVCVLINTRLDTEILPLPDG